VNLDSTRYKPFRLALQDIDTTALYEKSIDGYDIALVVLAWEVLKAAFRTLF